MSNLNISTILFYSWVGATLKRFERGRLYRMRKEIKTKHLMCLLGDRTCPVGIECAGAICLQMCKKICTWMFVICVSFTKAPTRHLGNSLRRTDLAENRQQLLPSASHSCERAAVWPTENNGSSPDVREPPALVKESSETLGRLCSLLSMQSDKPNGNLYKEISKGSAPQNS